jgi:hypothetical protein
MNAPRIIELPPIDGNTGRCTGCGASVTSAGRCACIGRVIPEKKSTLGRAFCPHAVAYDCAACLGSPSTGDDRLREALEQAEADLPEEAAQWYGKYEAGWKAGARWALARIRAATPAPKPENPR